MTGLGEAKNGLAQAKKMCYVLDIGRFLGRDKFRTIAEIYRSGILV